MILSTRLPAIYLISMSLKTGMNKLIKLDVFGKQVLAIHTNDGWEMFHLSEGGKRRPATEIFVPNFVKETEIENYIEDICHEWATERHPNVQRLK